MLNSHRILIAVKQIVSLNHILTPMCCDYIWNKSTQQGCICDLILLVKFPGIRALSFPRDPILISNVQICKNCSTNHPRVLAPPPNGVNTKTVRMYYVTALCAQKRHYQLQTEFRLNQLSSTDTMKFRKIAVRTHSLEKGKQMLHLSLDLVQANTSF